MEQPVNPVDIPPIQHNDDTKSNQEERCITDQEYADIQRQRKLEFKKHVHQVSVGVLYSIVTFYGFAAFTWMYHLLMPVSSHFMPSDNFVTLQSLLFGTIVGGLASQFASKVFSD